MRAPTRCCLQQRVQAARDTVQLPDSADREEGAGNVGLRAGAAFVADDEALVLSAEVDLEADRLAGEADRVDLAAVERRAARGAEAERALEGDLGLRLADLAEPPGELAGGAARRVHLAGVRVVDDLPARQ